MKKCFGLLGIFLFVFKFGVAQNAMSSSEILLSLNKLNTLGSVMYIAAHPDDENTRLLAFLANERKYRTCYLSLTRGDGGQNLIGSEQGDMLGLIRTEELLAARRIDGAEQWFTRARDFGYSKNPEETFRFWDKQKILYDVVYAIRKFRPDVIICRFPTTGEGGHGHHTASAILALEAFSLAADSTVFPDQLKELKPWKSKRIFWNTFNFGTTNTTSPDQLKIDVGTYNSLLGKSYGELAAESRTMHKSQGFGSAGQRGTQLEYFKLLKGDTFNSDIFDGINSNWSRLSSTANIQKQIDLCLKNFSAAHPEKSLPSLAALYKLLYSYKPLDEYSNWWKNRKLDDLKKIIVAAAGLYIETTTNSYYGSPGSEIELNSQIVMRNSADIFITYTLYSANDTQFTVKLNQNTAFNFKRKIRIHENEKFSDPRWLQGKKEYGSFSNVGAGEIGLFNSTTFQIVSYSIQFSGIEFSYIPKIQYKFTDPVKGEIYRPFEILPPLTISPVERLIVFNGNESKKVYFTVKANADNQKGYFVLQGGGNCEIKIKQQEFDLKKKGDEIILEASIELCDSVYDGFLIPSVVVDGKSWEYGIRRIEYDHIPYRFVLSDEPLRFIKLNIKTNGKRIAYINGAGDDVASCLKQIGYQVDFLSDDMIEKSDLNIYDAIVCGVRAYNTRDRLPLYKSQLMDYIKKGGRLIVQYNTNSRVGPMQNDIGPYKFTISRNRVTDESAPVYFINDTSNLLRFPNVIKSSDFNAWVQERGIYFATELDSNYHTVFNMQDSSEALQSGSLIYAQYGRGYFIYTGLAFFRQLPAGVPGAYKLFVNLLSIPARKP